MNESGRRLLLVSYHFGRDCPTGGIRWNSTAQELVRDGWDIDVITLDRPDLEPPFTCADGEGQLEILAVPRTDVPDRALGALSRLARSLRGREQATRAAPPVPPGDEIDPRWMARRLDAEVWRKGERRPLYERLNKVLDGIVELTADAVWSRRALRRARRLLGERSYRAVLVSTPPHYTQYVGVRLSKEYGLPYVGDYRDPWLLGIRWLEDYVNPVERLVASSLEPHCLRGAAVVLHNTPRAREAIAADFPGSIAGRHLSVPNGYDSVGDIEPPDPDCFRIAYTGWLHAYMDPRPLFVGCRALLEARSLPPDRFRIEFVGTSSHFAGVDLGRLAATYGLDKHFEQRTRVSREEARRIQQRAAVLVAYDHPHPLAVPSKFYEYAQMKGTMLLLGDPDGAMADLAAVLDLKVHALGDQRGIDSALLDAQARWERGELDAAIDPSGRFDRRRQTAAIREVLESL